MHYLAFDVAKEKVDGVLMTKAFKIKKRLLLENSPRAIGDLLLRIKASHPHLTIGAESTGIYHLPVLKACEDTGLNCIIINPLLTRQMLKSSIRKRKTDTDDAVRIAKLLMQNEGRVMAYKEATNKSKIYVRSALKLSELYQALSLHKRYLGKVLDEVPEIIIQEEKELKQALKRMKKEAIAASPTKERKLLESLPGIGSWLASVILAEIDNIGRFKNADSLIAFAGLDPTIKQSGANLNTQGKLTKRGSKQLRWALTCAAGIAKIHDPELKHYYLKKRSEGRKYREALCILGRKMAYRIYAVLKRQTPYLIKQDK